LLRHDPGDLPIDRQGWVPVKDLMAKVGIDRNTMDKVVENNNKKRFEYDEAGTKIRARQGHSIEVEHGYEPAMPPDELYHGTARHILGVLYKEGLKKMRRHHVHLSPDTETAVKVGQRHGKPVVLVVDAKKMHEEGAVFYHTDNDVWLVDYVPPGRFREHVVR
jgi:putative RNA 2'-phosphotransferase